MKHLIKTTFATALFTLATTGFAADTSTTSAAANVSPQERAKIEEVVHQYLVNNPQVLVESMQVLQRKQMEEAEKTVKQTQQSANQFADALFRQSADPVAGNPNGKVTVVEFFDYQCPHCVDMAPTTAAIIKANPDVRIVFKDFPIRGAASQLGARAAVAANKQGKYYEFSHALLTANQPITQDSIIQIAKKVGLDTEKLQKDMNDGSVDAVLKANYKLAQDLKLFGTPAFFIAKTDVNKDKGTIIYIPGQMDQKQLQAEIDKAAKS
jgi:protein-disulfide isomerase